MDQLANLLIIIIFVLLGIISFFLYKISFHYKRLIDETGRSNLREILDTLLERLGQNEKEIKELKKFVEKLSQDSVYYVQKVGILRFNPFSDTGGDQSFVLAILDGTDTGIVLTSLHTRGITRWYAKNVKSGQGVDHELSKEEQEAIKRAVHLKVKALKSK